jgi:homoserine dehydrogenase
MPLRACLFGFGKVGKAFASLLISKRDELEKLGIRINITCIITRKFKVFNEGGINLYNALTSLEDIGKSFDNLLDLIREGKFDYVFDFTSSSYNDGEPGYTIIREAVSNEVNVITASKAPLALHFKEIMDMVKRKGVKFRYQATVMSGTPSINLKEVLPLRRVKRIRGILNGTTNFILSKMEEGMKFEEAIAEAKKLGYAEEDPSTDINGIDTAAKLTILLNTYIKEGFTIRDIRVQGIQGISSEKVKEAKRRRRKIRLVGDSMELKVSPTEIGEEDVLYSVNGVNNCIEFETEFGNLSIIGVGAGPTNAAYGALSDLIIAETKKY